MTFRRILLIASAVVALGLAAVAAWFVLSIDRLVAREIERAGTETTGTRVSVAGVSLKLDEGSGTIRSFRVANPSGFSSAPALEAGAIRFDLDLASLSKREPIVVEEVIIEAPRLLLEMSGAGKANMDVIAKHAAAAGGAGDKDAQPTRVRIDRLVIRGASLDADATAVSGGKRETIRLDDIVMKNVGGKSGGTPDAVSAEIVAVVQKHVMRAAAKEGFKRLLEAEKKDLGEKVTKGIKGLFGK